MTNSIITFAGIGFFALTLIYFWLLARLLWKGIDANDWSDHRKTKIKNIILGSLITWGVFVSVWSGSGIMGNFSNFPFNFIPVVAIPLVTITIVTLTGTFKQILSKIAAEKIIQLQSFRFFVEILLWMLFISSAAPIQMTFEGRNFDILSGITAPLIAYLVLRNKISKPLVLAWNIACLLLLINIVTVAILSTPSPVRVFMNEPANTIVTTFPVSFLPGFLVPLAYTLHFFSIRQLSAKDQPAIKKHRVTG
jgi:hypothetical protein